MQSLGLIVRTRRYFAPAWVFASLNVMIGTWVLYIPYVKEKLSLSDGQLGIALFFLSMGTLSMIAVAPRIINWLGAGRVTFYGILSFTLLFQFPLLASNYTLFCFTLFLAGMGSSITDISMNALVSEIEKEDRVQFMSACHGFFSLGGVLGAGLGSLLIVYFSSPSIHMLTALGFILVTNLFLYKSYFLEKGNQEVTDHVSFNIWVFRSLAGLALISLVIFGSEGAIEHWSKLFMQEVVQTPSEQLAGFGFVAFSATMTIGRFYGDALSTRFGAYTIIIGGCVISLLGFVTLLQATTVLAILGFSLVGVGYSVIVPELFRLAGKSKHVSSATGISFVAGVGYVGFLLSPAIMGFLSEFQSLELSFKALMFSTLFVLLIAIVLRRKA